MDQEVKPNAGATRRGGVGFSGTILALAAGVLIGHYVWQPSSASPNISGASSNLAVHIPKVTHTATTSIGTPISSLPEVVQEVLQFQPNGFQNNIAYCVEDYMSYTTWEGSENVPGTFKTKPGPHGASDVTWTVKAQASVSDGISTWKKGSGVPFEFQISQNGNYITFLNNPASAVNIAYGG